MDEEKVFRLNEIIDEISIIRAEGASITGGEPMQRYDLVVKVIRMLKDYLGRDFHIHLYTSGFGATKEAIKYLDKIGLDEIRFHIVNDSVWKLVEFAAKNTSMDVGIEVPAIPGEEDRLWRIVLKAAELGAKFVNINELEVSETNIEKLLFRGFKIDSSGRAVVGSSETALKVVEMAAREGINIAVHFCPAIYKDVVQHRARMVRKARMCTSVNDIVTEDGYIVIDGEEVEPRLELCAPMVKSDNKQSYVFSSSHRNSLMES